MVHRSDQVAAWLAEQGVRRGDRVMVMLGNQVELWETMLAVMKLGAVILPATTALGPADLADRIERGGAKHVVTSAANTAKFAEVPGDYGRIVVDGDVPGWADYRAAATIAEPKIAHPETAPDDPLLLYFTSGTTSRPKLVQHTQASYPLGHLTTMYWIGVRPGDIHLNISSPGWAKHAWSCFFTPWIAEAPCSSTTTPGSTLRRCSRTSAAPGSPRSAHRRPCGGCSSTRTSPAAPARCGRSSPQVSPSTPR